jgi:hypothetical protein
VSDRLLVATRKGLFDLRRGTSQWAIAELSFVGDPVSMVLPDPGSATHYAALALGHFGVKLHRSDDDGRNWAEVAAPAYPRVEGDEKAPSVSLIWALEGGGGDRPDLLWAGTIPGGLFRSTDRGETWTLVDALWDLPQRAEWFGGGYDEPGIHSICVDPRDPGRLAVAISCGGVWLSDDCGDSWRLCGPGMYAEFMPPEQRDNPNIQDVHRVVQSPSRPETLWAQHHNGVFRSTDGARSWHEITAIRPSKFGFAVAVHPDDADTAWFVPAVKDECRVPVDGAFVVARTRDGGKSFETLSDGLPQTHAYDLVYRHGLAVDPSGTRLAVGSTTGHLWVSEDGGDHWTMAASHLPPIACVRFA